MRTEFSRLALIVGLAVLLAGCGDDTASDQPTESPPAAGIEEPAVVAEAPAPAAEADAPASPEPAPPESAEAPAGPVEPVVVKRELTDIYIAIQVDPAAIQDPHDYVPLALEACGDKPICQVGIWTDPEVTPTTFPVRVAQLRYQMFTYGRNRETGYEKSLWNCFDYPEQEPEGCIPRPLR